MKKSHCLSVLLLSSLTMLVTPSVHADFSDPGASQGMGGFGGGDPMRGNYSSNHDYSSCEVETDTPSEGYPNDISRNEGDTRQRTGTAEAASQSGIANGRSPGAVTGVDLIHTDRVMNPMRNTGLGGRDRR